MNRTDLSKFDNSGFDTGAGFLKRLTWYLCSAVFIHSHALLPYAVKCGILRLFGATIGKGVVIKPRVNIKYPWKLSVGDHSWIGEGVWIDCLDVVDIGANVCISQGALILSGNHDYSKSTFDLMVAPIHIGDGAWIGARAMVAQGVHVGDHAVLAVGSIASSDLEPFGIYRGNPAQKVKTRTITA